MRPYAKKRRAAMSFFVFVLHTQCVKQKNICKVMARNKMNQTGNVVLFLCFIAVGYFLFDPSQK